MASEIISNTIINIGKHLMIGIYPNNKNVLSQKLRKIKARVKLKIATTVNLSRVLYNSRTRCERVYKMDVFERACIDKGAVQSIYRLCEPIACCHSSEQAIKLECSSPAFRLGYRGHESQAFLK